MTLQHYYDGTLLTTAVLLADEKGFSSRASIGQVDTSTVYVDDPTAAHDFVGYKTWKMVEDACPVGRQVVWHGYVGDQTISRELGSASYQLGVQRRWELELIEDNGWPSRQIIISASANRPAETVSARITWVLTMRGMTGIIWDHGLVDANATVMEANDYRDRTAKAVLDDCSLITGWNWFVRYNETHDHRELIFQDSDYSLADPAILKISNVAADINLTTVWPPNIDARQTFGASRLASGLLLPFSGGTDYDQDPATAVLFGTVDQVAPTSAVKTKTAARAQITRLLAQHNEQDMSLENVVLQLPAANLNDVRHGQRISSVRLSHGRGAITGGIPMRVRSKAFSRPENLTQGVYDVALSLSPALSRAGIVQQFSYRSGDATGEANTFASLVTAGNLLVLIIGRRAGDASSLPPTVLVGSTGTWTTWAYVNDGFNPYTLCYYVATNSPVNEQIMQINQTKLQWTMYEIARAGDPSTFEVLSATTQGTSGTKSLGSFTPPTAGHLQIAGFIVNHDSAGIDQTVGSGWTEDQQRQDYTTGKAPLTVQMHSDSAPVVQISGVSHPWAAVAVNIKPA